MSQPPTPPGYGAPVPPQPGAPAPYGAPAPGGAYPPPGAPVPPGAAYPPAAYPPPGAPVPGLPTAPPAKKKAPVRLIVGLVAVVVVIVIVVVGFVASRDDAHNAKAGDCLAGANADDLKIVDCSKPHDYKVVGAVKDKTQSEASLDPDICAAYPSATTLYWWGEVGKKGDVLCLEDAS